MTQAKGVGRGWAGAAIVLTLVAWPLGALAQDDYSDKDFSLRLAPSFVRFLEASATGGGTVANRWSPAINPASVAWTRPPGKYGMIIAPYYSQIQFKAGTRLRVTGETFTWDLGEWGVVQPTLSQIRSNRATDRQGLVFGYTVDSAQVQWGKRSGEWAVGANLNYADAEVTHDLGPLRVSDASANSYRLRLGGLYQPAERWLAGLIVEYGFVPYRAEALAMGPMGPIIGPMGPVTVRLEGTQQQWIVRPGISYEYAEYSTVYLDYQAGSFFSKRGTLNSHWVSFGVDHRILEPLFVRAGASVDARGNAAFTCGLGAHLSRWCSVDLGYHYDPLPELQPEFGRAQVLQMAVNARF